MYVHVYFCEFLYSDYFTWVYVFFCLYFCVIVLVFWSVQNKWFLFIWVCFFGFFCLLIFLYVWVTVFSFFFTSSLLDFPTFWSFSLPFPLNYFYLLYLWFSSSSFVCMYVYMCVYVCFLAMYMYCFCHVYECLYMMMCSYACHALFMSVFIYFHFPTIMNIGVHVSVYLSFCNYMHVNIWLRFGECACACLLCLFGYV